MALKHNSKKTLDIIASQKKRNATAAYKEVHPNASHEVAKVAASQLLAKPEAQIYLQEHISKAKETVVALMDSDKEEVRFKASEAILDRELGKATQRIEKNTSGITLNIDLTSALAAENPASEA